jgi:hypothetical protein
LWQAESPPSGLFDALGRFWFDVTKTDWRQTLVMTVSQSGLQNRPSLYWFDLHQQFGTPGVLLAIAGFVVVAIRRPRIGVLLFLLYLVNLVFAWTYNVGDVHVFFLPSHYFVALCAGAGVAALAYVPNKGDGPLSGVLSKRGRPPFSVPLFPFSSAVAAACVLYAVWRGYDTFPAVDRSWDHRPEQVLSEFVTAPNAPTRSAPQAIFGVDANWQVQNGFEYFMKRKRPGVLWFTWDNLEWLSVPGVSDRFRHFTDVNRRAGQDIIVTSDFAAKLRTGGYQPGFDDLDALESRIPREQMLAAQIGRLPPRTTYALGILRPNRESPLDMAELTAAWNKLTNGTAPLPALNNYTIVLGEVGHRPFLIDSRDRPFRLQTNFDAANFDIRMESWLPTDTIRRMGFGHVIVNRRHTLTLERGVSFAALGAPGEPSLVIYRSSIFAPLQRWMPR